MTFSKKYKVAIGLVFIGLALILTTKIKSMFTVYIFSEVKGQVVSGGKPGAGATLVRTYDWGPGDQQGRDETKTDTNGEFTFPPIKKIMILGSLLPHEPFIRQEINAKIEGKTYLIWRLTRRNYSNNREIWYIDKPEHETPIYLLCDIATDPEPKEVGAVHYYGIGILRQEDNMVDKIIK